MQFWRKKGVQPGTSKVYLIKWPMSDYIYIQYISAVKVNTLTGGAALSVKYNIMLLVYLILQKNHSTAIVFILCVFDFIRQRLDYQDLCAD